LKKLGIIVCNNGLGHIKRVLWVLKNLIEICDFDIRVDIFVNTDKLKYFSKDQLNVFSNINHKVRFNNISAEIINYENEFINKYKSSIETSDLIWSDNLLFPIKYCKNVVLTGSFIWPELIKNENTIEEMHCFIKSKPLMIGNKYFATSVVRNNSEFYGVGLHSNLFFDPITRYEKALLLSFGKSKYGEELMNENFDDIKNKLLSSSFDHDYYVEPKFYRKISKNKSIKKATYSNRMYSKVQAAVIRPGMGTICDCLSKGIKIFSFHDENYEMNHNSSILKNMGLGLPFKSPVDALDAAMNYFEDIKQQREFINKLKKLDFDGLMQTAKKINTLFYD